MDEKQAEAVAEALGGTTYQSGGETWLVVLHREDGKVVVVSDDAVCEYKDDEAFEKSKPSKTIVLH